MADEPHGNARSSGSPPITSGRVSDYLEEYLRVAPVALAAWRSVEAKHFGSLNLERPILDLGCGFGEFGGVFFEEPAEVGLDISARDLRLCGLGHPYRSLVQADAHRLPFPTDTFQTVMSVSVLEHISNVPAVFAEASRVLRPGGTFAFSVPLVDLDRYMLFPPLLRRAGLARLADWYVRRVHTSFKHVNLLSPEAWVAMAVEAGFVVEVQRRVISRAVTRIFDAGLLTASLSQVGRRLTGGRFVWRPAPLVAFWRRILQPHVEADEVEGSNLFVVATKPPVHSAQRVAGPPIATQQVNVAPPPPPPPRVPGRAGEDEGADAERGSQAARDAAVRLRPHRGETSGLAPRTLEYILPTVTNLAGAAFSSRR